MKRKIFDIQNLFWLALLLALAGSLKHLAAVFASIDGNQAMGWLQALAIDAGLFALAYSIRIRKTDKRSVKPLWFGVVLFSVISIYGNYAYGVVSTVGQLPWWIEASKPIVLAASLPILVLFLSELISDDRQHAQAEADREAKRLARKEARETEQEFNLDTLTLANEVRKRDRDGAVEALLNLLRENPNITHSAAGRKIGRAKSTVSLYLSQLEGDGVIHKNGNGWKVVE